MKNLLLITSLLLLWASSSQAQHYVGVIGGFNRASLDISLENDTVEKNSSSSQFGIGAVLALDLGSHWALQLEPMYLKKGGRITPDPGGSEFEFTASYFEIPIFVKKSFGNKLKPFVMAGPMIAFNLDSEVAADLNNITFVADMAHLTKSLDFGFGFGAGVSHPVGFGQVTVEAQYKLGLKDTFDDGEVQFRAGDAVINETLDGNVNAKNRGWQVMLGLLLPLGGGRN